MLALAGQTEKSADSPRLGPSSSSTTMKTAMKKAGPSGKAAEESISLEKDVEDLVLNWHKMDG